MSDISYFERNEGFKYGSIALDPKKRKVFNVEDMNTGVPVYTEEPVTERQGVVSFFNDAKGYGFIKDLKTQESIFVHTNQLTEMIRENDKVTFLTERGPKGLNAVDVKKTS